MGLLHIMCHIKQVILRSSTEVFFIFKSKETGLDLIFFFFYIYKKNKKNPPKKNKKTKPNIATAWLLAVVLGSEYIPRA